MTMQPSYPLAAIVFRGIGVSEIPHLVLGIRSVSSEY